MKIIAFYLPQFHTFPENDAWWGKGFTEWTNTKKSKPQFKDHYQPHEPQNDYYYNLLDPTTFSWQIKLAKKYGIYGFCFYQYWFGDNHLLMEKPLEMFLNNKEYDINFCISWANESWTRAWDGKHDIIMEQDYGDENTWKKHFEYLYPFFIDDRYIKINNKPLFILYKPEIFPQYIEMFNLWNKMAKEKGLPGISFAVQGAIWNNMKNTNDEMFDYRIMYEPGYTTSQSRSKKGLFYMISSASLKIISKIKGISVNLVSYKAVCKNIVRRKVYSRKFIPGFCVGWDNTPRKGKNATCFIGSSPNVFYKYLTKLIKKTKKEYGSDMLFINAWNEWAESCHLEPDKKYGTAYLEAVKQALIDNNEFVEDNDYV